MFIDLCRGVEILSASECGLLNVELCGSYCLRESEHY